MIAVHLGRAGSSDRYGCRLQGVMMKQVVARQVWWWWLLCPGRRGLLQQEEGQRAGRAGRRRHADEASPAERWRQAASRWHSRAVGSRRHRVRCTTSTSTTTHSNSTRPRDRPCRRTPRGCKDHSTVRVEVEGTATTAARSSTTSRWARSVRRRRRTIWCDLGIARDRMTTISYGEELPICHEETESCWSRNRRAHFVTAGVETDSGLATRRVGTRTLAVVGGCATRADQERVRRDQQEMRARLADVQVSLDAINRRLDTMRTERHEKAAARDSATMRELEKRVADLEARALRQVARRPSKAVRGLPPVEARRRTSRARRPPSSPCAARIASRPTAAQRALSPALQTLPQRSGRPGDPAVPGVPAQQFEVGSGRQRAVLDRRGVLQQERLQSLDHRAERGAAEVPAGRPGARCAAGAGDGVSRIGRQDRRQADPAEADQRSSRRARRPSRASAAADADRLADGLRTPQATLSPRPARGAGCAFRCRTSASCLPMRVIRHRRPGGLATRPRVVAAGRFRRRAPRPSARARARRRARARDDGEAIGGRRSRPVRRTGCRVWSTCASSSSG